MKINYKGNFEQIKLAVEDANEVLYSNTIYDLIRKQDGFNCTNKTPIEISEIIQNTKLEVEVMAYKPRYLYSKVLGYFVKSRPTNIFLNSRKLYRDTSSISNTIIHEFVHAVDNDFDNTIIDFGHNCGTFVNTAPYVIGNIAEIIINGHEIENLNEKLEAFNKNEFIHCLIDDGKSLIDKEPIIEETRIY